MQQTRRSTRREFLAGAAGAGAAMTLGCHAFGQGTPGVRRPNFVFIFADQLRAHALSSYGCPNVETPHLDRLAQSGVRFTNAVSACPLCTPYRGMIMTGRHPTHSGIVVNMVRANPNQPTLATTFKQGGYHTAFIGKWHLYNWSEEARVPVGAPRLGFDHWQGYNYHETFNHAWYYSNENPKKILMDGFETDVETDLALKYLRSRAGQDRPFLLVMAPHPPHPPHTPENSPAGYLDRIRQDIQWLPNVPKPSKRNARCYYAMIKNLDDNVGRLMAYLDESGQAENTIVVFSSDHGEMLASRGQWGKNLPYAESAHIPLIVAGAGVKAGTCDIPHSPIDHLSTLCGLAGIPSPETADGTDFAPVLKGIGKVASNAVLLANYSQSKNSFKTGSDEKAEWRAVKTDRYTYVRWLAGREALYDNQTDPYQQTNLSEGDSAALEMLRKRLTELLAKAHDEFLPGTAYGEWYDKDRNLLKTALGPIENGT